MPFNTLLMKSPNTLATMSSCKYRRSMSHLQNCGGALNYRL
jgi:hypothetical protein